MFAVRPTLCAVAAMRTASLRVAAAAAKASPAIQTRAFSVLPRLRPTSMLSGSLSSVFRSPILSQTTTAAPSIASEVTTATADVISPSSISRHPALAGLASQIRCGPRATMAGATRLIQKRRHGFLSRIRTKAGRKTLARRRTKGRKRLAY